MIQSKTHTLESTQQPIFMEYASRLPARGGATRIRHFNGTTRRTSDWDGLRRDNHLWFEEADCLVYFFSENASQRGASLKIPFEVVDKLKCEYLTNQCLRRRSRCENVLPGRTYSRLRNESDPGSLNYEFYIPAPSTLTREQTFSYHLTTRNLFAYAVGCPLVGEKMSTALIDLWTRIQEWELPVHSSDFTTYLEKQGYLDFTENTEHSLACLKLAEYARIRDVWIDSFVHCVGMHVRLDLSPEFAGISNTTMALITRTSLEMDLHIDRVVRAVSSFLDEDLGPEHLGLSKPARDHLDYFRTFLHGFYVNKFGYFPPHESIPFNKRPWTTMYYDFQNLYDYLADTKSSSDWTTNQSVTGGICVLQNVRNLHSRHDYPPLPHPLPLLPHLPAKQRTGFASQKGLRPLTLLRKSSASELRTAANQGLGAATNSHDAQVMRCPLVQEYQRFERNAPEGKLDIIEARKVRWLLVYGVLQMLTTIIKAPPEVKDAETPSYPLCAMTTSAPPWESGGSSSNSTAVEESRASSSKTMVRQALDDLEGRTSRMSIRPDCDADCAEDYFASMNMSRQDSSSSLNLLSPPLKRNTSFRSSMQISVHALQKSVVGSLGRRSSSRRASLATGLTRFHTEPADIRKARSVCDIVIEDYDRGNKPDQSSDVFQTDADSKEEPAFQRVNSFHEFDFGFAPAQEQDPNSSSSPPENQVETTAKVEQENVADSVTSPCESDFSSSSVSSSNSNRSSYIADNADSPTTELSSWDGGSRRNSGASSSTVHGEPVSPEKQRSQSSSNLCMKQKDGGYGNNILGGTHVPKGMGSESSSTSSTSSTASLGDAEKDLQLAETKEVKEEQKIGRSRWSPRVRKRG